MPGKTVSLRRYSEPPDLPLEPPVVAHATPDGRLRVAPGHALLGARPGARVVIVLWTPNLAGRAPFRVADARLRHVDAGAHTLWLEPLRVDPGEHVVHLATAPAGDERRGVDQRY